MEKCPPLPQRDRGGQFKLENPADGTPIRAMMPLGNDLLIITDKCTYRLRVADQIDPKRANPGLPHNFQQKLFDHGAESELLRRTLLQAKVLFRTEFQKIDVAEAMELALDAFTNLISMDQEARAFAAEEEAAKARGVSTGADGRSMTLPAVGNVRDRAKTFMQKADHLGLALLKLMRLFYPDAKNPDSLLAIVKNLYGNGDNFTKVCELVVPILRTVRDARDAFEHNPKNIAVNDFELDEQGQVWVPSISIRHRNTKFERERLSSFMLESVTTLGIACEMLMVHACSRSVQPVGGIQMSVGLLSDQHKAAMHCRFAYGSDFGDGNFVPCG